MKANKIIKGLALTLVIGAIGLTSVACGSKKADSSESKTVKLGVVGSDTDVWDYVAKKVEKEDGIKIEIVKFTDYNQPRSEEHTSELQSRQYLVCRLLLE